MGSIDAGGESAFWMAIVTSAYAGVWGRIPAVASCLAIRALKGYGLVSAGSV